MSRHYQVTITDRIEGKETYQVYDNKKEAEKMKMFCIEMGYIATIQKVKKYKSQIKL